MFPDLEESLGQKAFEVLKDGAVDSIHQVHILLLKVKKDFIPTDVSLKGAPSKFMPPGEF